MQACEVEHPLVVQFIAISRPDLGGHRPDLASLLMATKTTSFNACFSTIISITRWCSAPPSSRSLCAPGWRSPRTCSWPRSPPPSRNRPGTWAQSPAGTGCPRPETHDRLRGYFVLFRGTYEMGHVLVVLTSARATTLSMLLSPAASVQAWTLRVARHTEEGMMTL